jgi:adsorption protein B
VGFYFAAAVLPRWIPPAWLDRAVLAVLVPLGWAMLLSGLDDLLVDAAWAFHWLKSKLSRQAALYPPAENLLNAVPRQRIAILVPLWREEAVIAPMLEHNLASIRYTGYEFFCGCYPNDEATQKAVQSVAERHPGLHLCLCPHDGPTSKADCLNWIYQHVLLSEDRSGSRFDLIVTHDAEDLIHPDELRWINYYGARFDFVQTPVLPLPAPPHRLTQGLYCDEFAEYHSRDMVVRALLGGFIPGAGVGTGYRREALERLAQAASNRVFEPAALTEDYESGLRLYRLGCSQAFIPILPAAARCLETNGRDFVATREYFPSTWRTAVRQRMRWVTGIVLQGAERFGWKGRPGEVYWLWRDRKGLLGNPLSLAANLVFAYGLLTALWTRAEPLAGQISLATLAMQSLRTAVRMACSARVYGWWFALLVPVRSVYGNALNSCASLAAVGRYAWARLQGRPLRWVKTAHAYPSRAALLDQRRRIGEILEGSGQVAAAALQQALASCPRGMRIGEHLVREGLLAEDVLYDALSLQQGLPLARLSAEDIRPEIARALPAAVARRCRVLPFRIEQGSMHLAGPEPPAESVTAMLRDFTRLELRFYLIPPSSFEPLAAKLL